MREYALLKLHARLLVACALRVAVTASPDGVTWSEALAARCGYPSAVIAEQVEVHLDFLLGQAVSCRSLASGRRERTLSVRIPHAIGGA